jgi:hypothetical protein
MTTKTKPRLTYYDGQKAVDLWGDEGWTILSGDGAQTPDADYYKLIPTLYRAVDIRAFSVANMPFEILKGKTVYDSSADWQNKVGFMPNPKTLLRLAEASLSLTGRAYWFRDRSTVATKQLRYHLPTSVNLDKDSTPENIIFDRNVKNVPKKFTDKDYVYFWMPDPFVEFGPALNYPAKAAANACGVLLNMDIFADGFFERGAIKAMLLTVKGMPIESERQRLTDWWKRVVSGVKNAFGAQVINADAVTPVVVGEGMKELENTTLSQEKREDIAIATNVPMSLLFARAANRATAQQDKLNLLTGFTIGECEFIAGEMNTQIWEPLGLHWNFLPETLDEMQEDENERAGALKTYVDAGFPLVMACDILGVELTDKQRAELEAEKKAKEEAAKELAKQMAQKPPVDENSTEEDNNQNNAPIPQQDGQGDTQTQKTLASVPYTDDMQKWLRKALNALKRGNSPAVTFESMLIPANVYQTITANLQAATDESSIKAAFNCDFVTTTTQSGIDWELLREAVKAVQEL